MNQQTGKYIILAGIVVVTLGILVYFFHHSFRWLGKLPGDFRIESKNSKFYFPLTTMIIISTLLTVLINLLRKWF